MHALLQHNKRMHAWNHKRKQYHLNIVWIQMVFTNGLFPSFMLHSLFKSTIALIWSPNIMDQYIKLGPPILAYIF